MPSSRPNTIPTVVHLIRQLRPSSILDVGVGFGKWGHLFREYTDIIESESELGRYAKQNWRVRIDGIEGFPDYITDMHRFLYNNLYIGNAIELLPSLPTYDVIFMGDIIEHFEKTEGLKFLGTALQKARRALIITTPRHETGQEALCGNELERHRSLWAPGDFRIFERAIVRTIDDATYIIVLLKAGVPAPACTPPRQDDETVNARLRETKAQLLEVLPSGKPFILVDEEQIRPTLGRYDAIPFLEKNGKYWGPPADAQSAIAELERLRSAHAASIAFVWTTFWWLDHYRVFATISNSDIG